MRVSELEGWLIRQGWEPESNKRGSSRAWTHALYPGQRLTYHVPHKADGAELRPDVVKEIYRDLIAMKPADELEQVSIECAIHKPSLICRAQKAEGMSRAADTTTEQHLDTPPTISPRPS